MPLPNLSTSDDVVFIVAGLAALALFVVGVVERRRHRRALARLPLRISVNGSRGKSTVTRLLTGAVAAGGYRPLGKTTGTEPRLIHGWSASEVEIHRRPEGPNIGEQRSMVRHAVEHEADALVTECMAVTPDYQRTFHRELLDVNLLVVTNALDDHLEEMGPTARDVAEVFAATVPEGGTLVVAPGPHLEVFEAAAEQRRATFIVADPEAVDPTVLDRFDHLVLDEHVALVFAVTRHLGIDDEAAVEGMLASPVDPYATRLLPVGDPDAPATFVNAFPANDPASTLGIVDHLRARGHHTDDLVVIMHCRDDRIARTRQFAEDVLPKLPIDTLLVTGAATQAVLRAARAGRIGQRDLHDLTGRPAEAVLDVLDGQLRDRVVLGVGNLHGGGADIVAVLERQAVSPLDPQGAA
jgi:poly-gamma-glutamate synthase PgsB/CapB